MSTYGCFSSRARRDEIDSNFGEADSTVETGGTGGRDLSRAGSSGVGSGYSGFGGSIVDPIDSDVMDIAIVQGGTGDIGASGGTGDTGITDVINKDGGIDDAPCSPNCPALDWVIIPDGTFLVGSLDAVGERNEQPQHEVTVQSFKILKTEVTVSLYSKCVDAGVCEEPLAGLPECNWAVPGRENYPVNGVSWYNARTFGEWVGARLPSEAEWEYAARGGGMEVIYPWGNERGTCEHLVINSDGIGNRYGIERSMAVCSKPMGNTAQGLCDMAGNVFEWVEDDWHDTYENAPTDGSAWLGEPGDMERVYRGGAWYTSLQYNDSDLCGSASRRGNTPNKRSGGDGFRVVLDLR